MAEKIIKIPIEVVTPDANITETKVKVEAFRKIAEFVLEHPEMKAGDHFTIEGLDGKKIIFYFE